MIKMDNLSQWKHPIHSNFLSSPIPINVLWYQSPPILNKDGGFSSSLNTQEDLSSPIVLVSCGLFFLARRHNYLSWWVVTLEFIPLRYQSSIHLATDSADLGFMLWQIWNNSSSRSVGGFHSTLEIDMAHEYDNLNPLSLGFHLCSSLAINSLG